MSVHLGNIAGTHLLRALTALAGLALILCTAPGTALAERVTSPEIQRIEEFMAEAEFEQALELVDGELKRPWLSSEMTGRLYELQGLLHLYLGEEDAAQDSFRSLLKVAPDYRLQDDVSPKVKALFEEAREEMAAKISSALRLRHPRPAPAVPGEPIRLEIELESAPKGIVAKLFYRRGSDRNYSSTVFMETEDPGRWAAIVPSMDFGAQEAEDEPAKALEYFIEVQGPAGTLLAIAGKRGAPLAVPFAGASGASGAAAVQGSPWYKKWWVWTIVGVVAAGAVAGGIIFATSSQTGTVPVTVTLE